MIYELDLVRIERAHNPRLIKKVAREGASIYPEKPFGPEDSPQMIPEPRHSSPR